LQEKESIHLSEQGELSNKKSSHSKSTLKMKMAKARQDKNKEPEFVSFIDLDLGVPPNFNPNDERLSND
jgi:hypothetical protein